MAVRILTADELRQAVPIDDDALAAVESAFGWLAEGRVEMPPIMHVEVAEHRGDVDVKSAYVRGEPAFAVKIGCGFLDNPKRGLPTADAMMVLISSETGACVAVLLDRGYLTDLRTGLAGAVAARHLAPAHVETAGVVGVGAQARFQIECLKRVRPFRRLLAWGRDAGRTATYLSEMAERLGVEARAAASAEEVVRESQCVVTTTPSREPLLRAAWLHRGLHVTAMGSDVPGKRELEPALLEAAQRVVCDRLSQCRRLGELQGFDDPAIARLAPVELGEVTSGRAPGRQADDEISVCDLTGTGVQDTAIALHALRRAERAGLGHGIDV